MAHLTGVVAFGDLVVIDRVRNLRRVGLSHCHHREKGDGRENFRVDIHGNLLDYFLMSEELRT